MAAAATTKTETPKAAEKPASLATTAAEAPKADAAGKETPKADEKPAEGSTTPTDGQKADEGTKADDKPAGEGKETTTASEDDGQKAEQGAPEKYDLKLPDGDWLDTEDLADLEVVARANGWTNEQAQAALESHADALVAQSTRFLEATKADPTYGGTKLEATQQDVTRVMNRVRPAGTPRGDALRRLLDKSGYGNHIEVISFLADLGKLMADDAPPKGSAGDKPAPKSREEKFYGNS